MSDKSTFTSDEWSMIRSAPTFVSAGVAAADPGGIFHAIKEATAGAQAVAEFAAAHQNIPLFAALAEDKSIPAMPSPQQMMGEGDAATRMANFETAAIQYAGDALAIVQGKGTPEEASAYKEMLATVADAVAKAASEGGFLGFGGTKVSDKEQTFLGKLTAALGAVPPTVSQPA
jgi:hypothetical protein